MSHSQEVHVFQTRIPDKWAPMRLDQFLSKRFKYFSRGQWQKLIREDRVIVNGQPSRASHVLQVGAQITYFPTLQDEPEISRDFEVIYEDDYLLVVNKPAPCPTTQTGPYLNNTLESLVGEYLKGSGGKDFWVLHRLDMETTGAVMIAKQETARQALYLMLEAQKIQKTYLCITKGAAPLINHFCELPVGCSGVRRIRIKGEVLFSDPGKSAMTYFTTLQTQHPYHVVVCRLYTGRTNQIRIHLETTGQWIVGDKLYNPDEQIAYRHLDRTLTQEDMHTLEHSRMLIHAYTLRFQHPITQQSLLIKAPLKPDMQSFMHRVGLNSEPMS